MDYPGRIIKVGEQDLTIVKAVKIRLNETLGINDNAQLRLNPDDPEFGPRVEQAIKLFQARNVDTEGRPLKQDGVLGALTWAALFGAAAVPSSNLPKDPLLARVLQTAGAEEAKHVREVPVNSNRGPRVEEYLARAGAVPGQSWCCAFVYWCFDESAKALGRANPMPRTAGCLDHWERASARGTKCILAAAAMENPGLVQSGMVFVVDHGGGLGHTGLIERVAGGLLTTIEGNTDASKTREGGGVYRLTRKINEINKGFIDYTG
jgi:hypothetical protein